MRPETRYARRGDLHNAYQVVGDGPRASEDLVAGSGLRFQDRGSHPLKGIPDEVHLYRVLS